MLTTYRRQLDYDDWANREVIRSLVNAESAPPRAVALTAHIVACGWLWYHRIQGSQSPVPVWPDWDLDTTAHELDRLAGAWEVDLRGRDDASLAAVVRYVNSQGEPWENTVAEMLQHVVMHGVYHRGQIAALLAAAGEAAPYTDFIHCVRRKLLA